MFKDIIENSDELKDFRAAVRSALTPELLVDILTKHTITDPSLIVRLEQAVGKKSNKPLNTRLADEISAAILQFNNTHEMFAYYPSQGLFYEWLYSFSNEYDDGVVSVFTEDGYKLSIADIVRTSDLTFDPSNALDSLHYSQCRQFTSDKLPGNAVVLRADKLHGMCILFGHDDSSDFSVTDDYASAADTFSATASESEECFFANSFNHLLRYSEKTTFFDTDVRAPILESLQNALINELTEHAQSLSCFDPHSVKDVEYRWDDGTIGLMFSASDMWMAAYNVKSGRPIAMSCIRLHAQDKRRTLIRA